MRMALLTVFALATVFSPPTFAFNPDELNRITFDNATGTTIEMIFLSPNDSKFWGPDLIGADYVLKNGAHIAFYLHYPGGSFRFDILAVDDKGNKLETRDLDIADGTEPRVALASASPKKNAPDLAPATVRIDNMTGHEIQYLFVSPGDSRAWGADLLDDETTLADGDSYSFVLPTGRDKVNYNVMAVDENNNEYQFGVTINPKAKKEFTFAVEPGDLITAK